LGAAAATLSLSIGALAGRWLPDILATSPPAPRPANVAALTPVPAAPSPVPAVSPAPEAAVAPASPPSSAAPAPAEPRLGWPDDGRIDGLYAQIGMIGQPWFPKFLDHVAAAGMNAVVFDGKDYSGWLTYPSSIPLAAETRSASHAVLKSLSALVHVAHERGIRVLLRVTCFHDPWMATHRPELAIKGMNDWLDPHNPAAQDYILSVVDETLASGVDEIQLDYVRFPTDNISHADFALGGAKTTDVIAGFVERVHQHTHQADVPLALDVFGVVAWQRSVDVRATGQDLARLGQIVEVLSPMVYPSHFREGFNGYSEPGAHPEVVAFGTAQAEGVLRKAGSTAVVRPWIQAFPWHAPGYSTEYVAREIVQAKAARGNGWLAWNAGGYYNEVFAASASMKK
jgi:hypothetical protein